MGGNLGSHPQLGRSPQDTFRGRIVADVSLIPGAHGPVLDELGQKAG